MNDFCLYCVGNNKQEVKKCKDRDCPFWYYRRANLDWQERELKEKKNEKIDIKVW